METYILLLVVTSEQEDAIQLIFSRNNWHYMKMKALLTEHVSSRLNSLNSDIKLAQGFSGKPEETNEKTISELYELANQLASDMCKNQDLNPNTMDINKGKSESTTGSASVIVKTEETIPSDSETDAGEADEVKICKIADNDDDLLNPTVSSYTNMGTRLSTTSIDDWTNNVIPNDNKKSIVSKQRKNKHRSSYSEIRKKLRKRHSFGKKEAVATKNSKHPKSDKTHRCPKCHKQFTPSQFLVHQAKDRCQLICCFCKKNFGDNFAKYTRHIRNVHTSANLVKSQGEGNEQMAELSDRNSKDLSDRNSKDLPVSGAYCCNVCGTSYVSQIRYTKHVEKGDCKQICGECGKVYLNNSQNFIIHTRTHSKSLQFACTDCHKSFVTQAKLQLHMKEHTGELFSCRKCTMTFSFQNHLSYHWKVAHGSQKEYMCDLCGAVYKSQASLNYHTDTSHSDERPYSCHICAARFKVKVTLKAHMLVHSDLKNYQCSKCCKQFKTRSLLSNHERRHAMRFTHTCDVCFKGFYGKRALTEHKNTHSGEKPHKCPFCDYACASMSNLIKHGKIHENSARLMGSSASWPKGHIQPGGSTYSFPFS